MGFLPVILMGAYRCIQKKRKKTVLKENWFFRTKQEKIILYKRREKNDFVPKMTFFLYNMLKKVVLSQKVILLFV